MAWKDLTAYSAMSKPATLNSASTGLTDECLVALHLSMDGEKCRQRWDRNKRPAICVCRAEKDSYCLL